MNISSIMISSIAGLIKEKHDWNQQLEYLAALEIRTEHTE